MSDDKTKEEIHDDFIDRFVFESIDKVKQSDDYEVVEFDEDQTFRHVPTGQVFTIEV